MTLSDERIQEIAAERAEMYCLSHQGKNVTDCIASAIRQAVAESHAWIPVAERLPEIGERFLFEDGIMKSIQIGVCVQNVAKELEGSGVTRWQPMPIYGQPPETPK